MAKLTSRLCALRVLQAVIKQGRSLSAVLPEQAARLTRPQEAPQVQVLCYGVLRSYFSLKATSTGFLKKPLKAKDFDVELAVLLGLYQIQYMHIPDYAVVKETVDLARQLRKPWAKGLINGVLREFLRQDKDARLNDAEDLEAQWDHPLWFIHAVKKSWPTQWTAILNENNKQAPMTLRVNLARQSRAAYLARLSENGVTAFAGQFAESAVQLEHACAVESLPGFQQGDVSVQDEGAQLAAALMGLEPGLRVLDACCAPGGKTSHMLESVSGLEMIAIDKEQVRLQRVEENLLRLGLQAELKACDAAQTSDWWDGVPFDRILLDVPCTATGVIRRHPDIKLLRRESDVSTTLKQQRQLLDALWPLLKPGGRLVYATCSILEEENADQMTRFIQEQGDQLHVPALDVAWGQRMRYGRQTLPGEAGMDGFYYAVLEKRR